MDADGRPGRVFNAAHAMQPNGGNRLADTAPPRTGRRSFGEDMPAMRKGMRIVDFMPGCSQAMGQRCGRIRDIHRPLGENVPMSETAPCLP
jgi:hypothetical protein